MKSNKQSGSTIFKWTREYLVQLLSSGKSPMLTDPLMINAFHKIDRADFVPEKYKQNAYADIEIDLGYGEKLTKPTIVAQMVAYLKPKLGGKYLDIGSGTGYSAAIISYMVGEGGKVYSIERVQWIWEMARANIQKYPNLSRLIQFIYRDGMEGLVNQAPYDGIHIAFSLEKPPENLKMQLKMQGGRLVYPDTNHNLHLIIRKGLEDFEEELIPGFTLESYKEGVA